MYFNPADNGPVGWGYRIHLLLLCRGIWPHPNDCPGYDTKQSDLEAPVMRELWGMLSTPSLPSLPGSLWSGVVAPDRALSMGHIELICLLMLNLVVWNWIVLTFEPRTSFKQRTYSKLNCLKWNCFCMLNWVVWNKSFDIWLCLNKKKMVILNWIDWNKTDWLNCITWNRNVFDK